jgi:hypothetical protein
MKKPARGRLTAGLCSLFWGLILVLCEVQPVAAQDNGTVQVYPPDISKFPNMVLYFDARDAQGAYLQNLTSGDVTVLEDNTSLPADALDYITSGAQIIVAFNPAPSLAYAPGAKTRFQLIQQQLIEWASLLPASDQDDFSLVTNGGILAEQLTNPKQWAQILQSYKPDLMTAVASLDSLNKALDLATDTNPSPNMKRAILYITPIPSPADLKTLPDIGARAKQLGVHVFVWMIGPSSSATSAEAKAFQQITSSTAGDFFMYSGTQALPDLETYFKPLRGVYRLEYTSAASQSGQHSITVQVNHTGTQLTSAPVTFKVTVQPPNPVLLSPPGVITRQWVRTSGSSDLILSPESITIKIQVEFPDGLTRPLRATRLFVDGKLAAENTVEPFDQINWPLDAYTKSGTHTIKVEIEDSLGLKQATIDTPVKIVVTEKPVSFWEKLVNYTSSSQAWIALAIIAFVGVLALVFIIGSRRNWFSRLPGRSHKETSDPVTQPVLIRMDDARPRPSATVPRSSVIRIPARLVRLDENSQQPIPGKSIAINQRELSFGSDPKKALFVLDSPSVSPLHARLTQTAEDVYILSDEGSVAGTWVNFAPVSSQGVRLVHGDLVHIGKLAFRFELATPPAARSPHVSHPDEEA